METISARDLLWQRAGEFGRQKGLFAAKVARQAGVPCPRVGRSRTGRIEIEVHGSSCSHAKAS